MNSWSKNGVLSLRVLTSVILVPLIVWGIIVSSTQVFITVCALIILYAASEWTTLMGLNKIWSRSLFIFFILITLVGSNSIRPWITFAVALFWWLLALLWIVYYPVAVRTWNRSVILVFLGVEVLMPCWVALVKLRENFGPYHLLYLLILIWAADIGAYTAGKIWGQHKLIPKVSPGKTLEGVIGGLVLALAIAVAGGIFFHIQSFKWLLWLLLAVLTVLISIVGDLLISMLKRNRGLKDSGRLLPGHGGLLDRIDSLTAAAPFFCLGLIIMNF